MTARLSRVRTSVADLPLAFRIPSSVRHTNAGLSRCHFHECVRGMPLAFVRDRVGNDFSAAWLGPTLSNCLANYGDFRPGKRDKPIPRINATQSASAGDRRTAAAVRSSCASRAPSPLMTVGMPFQCKARIARDGPRGISSRYPRRACGYSGAR